ncbi:MAG: hypothetical protein R3C99_11390 [Pirellulaceae bacterium]
MTSDAAALPAPSSRQFTIASLLWTMFTLSLVLGYLRQFGSTWLLVGTLVVIVCGAVSGAAQGLATGRPAISAFWAVLIGVSGYLSVSGESREGLIFCIAWTAVGMLTGGAVGAVRSDQPYARIAVGAVIALATMGLIPLTVSRSFSATPMFDVLCAPVVGGLVGLLVTLVEQSERRYRIRRHMTTCWILSAVLIGNLMVQVFV